MRERVDRVVVVPRVGVVRSDGRVVGARRRPGRALAAPEETWPQAALVHYVLSGNRSPYARIKGPSTTRSSSRATRSLSLSTTCGGVAPRGEARLYRCMPLSSAHARWTARGTAGTGRGTARATSQSSTGSASPPRRSPVTRADASATSPASASRSPPPPSAPHHAVCQRPPAAP
eukprot:7377419-Prymnesium_polylepis.1